jgi:diguanylate cyclase (GGDEF)-like protein
MSQDQHKYSILLPLLFCLVLLGLVGYYGYSIAALGRKLDAIEFLLAASTAGLAFLCVILLLQLRRLYRALVAGGQPVEIPKGRRTTLVDELNARNAENLRKLKTLANQVEILSAMREISLLASQDVNFESLVEHALTLVEQVIGTREIALFLRSQEDEKRVGIRAWRVEGKTRFGPQIDTSAVDSTHVTEVARYGNIKREEDASTLDLTVPVMVDREILGAVKVKIDKEQAAPDSLERAETSLRNIVNHISLAIKTPTLYDRAVLDGLTGLYTKRHLNTELPKLFATCRRLSKTLAVIMFDIDHFKNVNDTHGHLSGDIILREVASIIKRQIREYDTAYRYGGEEMCVLLPEIDAHSAVAVAERIRKAIEVHPMRGDQNQKVPTTVSGGVSVYRKYMERPDQLIAEADSALYEAKQSGRNQIKHAQPKTRTA